MTFWSFQLPQRCKDSNLCILEVLGRFIVLGLHVFNVMVTNHTVPNLVLGQAS